MDEGCARRIPGSIPGQRTSGAASPHVHSPFGPKGPCRSTVWLAGLRQLRGKGNICRTQRRMEETNMPTNGTTLPGRSLAEIRASLGAHIRMAAESPSCHEPASSASSTLQCAASAGFLFGRISQYGRLSQAGSTMLVR